MLLVALEEFGEAGDIGLCDNALILHDADDAGNEVAVEGGVLLLARVIDFGGYFGNVEDVAPELFVAGDVIPSDNTDKALDIGEDIVSLTLDESRGGSGGWDRWKSGGHGGLGGGGGSRVGRGGDCGGGCAVVVDYCGGIGIEVLHMVDVDVDFVVGVVGTGVACYVEIHGDAVS